jgi:hypothetical protein
MSRAAVFLDRNGVINEPAFDRGDGRAESPHWPQDVALCAGAVGSGELDRLPSGAELAVRVPSPRQP